jgi:hypothetical protein
MGLAAALALATVGAAGSAKADDRVEGLHIAVLVETVQDRNEPIEARIEACNKLQKFGPKAQSARPALLAALRERQSRPVVTGAAQQERWGDFGRYYVSAPNAWRDDGLTLRRSGLAALRAVGLDAKDLPELIAALKGLPDDRYQDSHGQHNALCRELAEALGELGPKAEGASPVLLQVVRGRIETKEAAFACPTEARVAAVETLGKVGSASPEVLRVLLKARELDREKTVREAAARALERLTPEEG